MPLLRDRTMLAYNRDLPEIRRIHYGNGINFRSQQHGDGLWDYAKTKYSQAKDYAKSYIPSTMSTSSSTKPSFVSRTVGAIGEAAGSVIGRKAGEAVGDKFFSGLKTGLKHADTIKSAVDLVGHSVKTGLDIAKSSEDYRRSKLQTDAQVKLDDEFFRQLRQASEETKKGRGISIKKQ